MKMYNNNRSGRNPQMPDNIGQKPKTFRDDTLKYVLVAEDNIMISSIIQEILKTMNYIPIVALNGRVAVEQFTTFMKDE